VIQINGLNKSLFGGGHTVKILNGIDLIIPSGQFVAITGHLEVAKPLYLA